MTPPIDPERVAEPTPEDFDDMHHALGRPMSAQEDVYRNHFCTEAGGEKARRFEALGLWDFGRTINDGRDAVYHVTVAGKNLLAEHLAVRDLLRQREGQ